MLARAGETINGIERYRVVDMGGAVDDAGVPSYSVTLEITFSVKESVSHL